jgi:hypothetical protein
VTARFPVIAFRLVVLVGVWVLGTSALSLAQDAGEQGEEPPATAPATPETQPTTATATLIVPDTRGLPYVFAKGVLEDAGFAWKVEGKVEAFAVNFVATQSAKPGTDVVDTGAPTLVLTLADNPDFGDEGLPQETSPYPGTELVLAKDAAADTAAQPDEALPQEEPPATTQGDLEPAEPESAEPAQTQPPTDTTPATTTESEPAADAPADGGEDVQVEVNVEAEVAAEAATRPPAFAVAGAPKEPLDEMPLPRRARLLGSWLGGVKAWNTAAQDHFAYQHAWIVTGAKFGWWRGSEALGVLVEVDEKLQRRFDTGAQYEAEARAALREVLRKTQAD